MHLTFRKLRATSASPMPTKLSTEFVFLCGMVLIGGALGVYLAGGQTNVEAGPVLAQWRAFRGNASRTGTMDPQDQGPSRPTVLWTFEPGERKGRVSIHSSPAVVDDQVYVGAMHQIQTFMQGYLYCINASDGRQTATEPIKLGQRLWRFTADGSLLPVYSSPTILEGRVYFGEGYHQDRGCRLFCLDAQGGQKVTWAKTTSSHVESSPWIEGNNVYFSAGDDGILCVDTAQLEGEGSSASPKTKWQFRGLHVDASPVVAGNLLFAGSVVGDEFQKTEAVALDTQTGEAAWRYPSPIPLGASPAFTAGHVYFGMASGKLNAEGVRKDGGVLCLEGETGKKAWEFRVGGGVFGSPALKYNNVYFGSLDGNCYCLDRQDGQLKWKAELSDAVAASPIASGDKIYVLTKSARLFCLDAKTGEKLWQVDEIEAPDEDAYSSPVLARGRLYVAAGGKVYCIGDKAASPAVIGAR